MPSIFYDLETSDKEPIGQILNYCFLVVDDAYRVIDECSGEIRISRLQLPRAGAILANRIDVKELQKRASDEEHIAMKRIVSFLNKYTSKSSGRIPLVGYNSASFDLPYLRTSLIRNGYSPYFGGKIGSRDLLLLTRHLASTQKSFPRAAALERDPDRLSLSLETLTREFGLLSGKQTHESREDVLLTIRLAQFLDQEHGLDVRTFEPYQVASLHQKADQGLIIEALNPEYDLSSKKHSSSVPMLLLRANDRGAALWVNLLRYQEDEGEKSIRWYSLGSTRFSKGKDLSQDTKWKKLATQASQDFAHIRLETFFPKSTCDIEQHIYRIHSTGFAALDALCEAIQKSKRSHVDSAKSKDAKVLYLRYLLRTHEWGSTQDDRVRKLFRAYALHRYGGELQLWKNLPQDKIDQDNDSVERGFHPTFTELLAEVEELRQASESKADIGLLDSLEAFYLSSELFEVAGKDLQGNSQAA